MEIRQIIEALDCLTTRQHRCAGCPFNPHPGMDWPYGCGKGQAEVVRAAKERLREMEKENAGWFTREEIESGVTPVSGWIEERDKNGFALMDTYQAVKVDGAWRVDGDISWSVPVERYITVHLPWSTYGERWRLWKDRPSDFHRWEEPWEIDH